MSLCSFLVCFFFPHGHKMTAAAPDLLTTFKDRTERSFSCPYHIIQENFPQNHPGESHLHLIGQSQGICPRINQLLAKENDSDYHHWPLGARGGVSLQGAPRHLFCWNEVLIARRKGELLLGRHTIFCHRSQHRLFRVIFG